MRDKQTNHSPLTLPTMSSQELVLSPEFLSLLEETEECCAEDFFLLTEEMGSSELSSSLDDFYTAAENLTERLEELDEDLTTDAGNYIQKLLDQLSVDYNKLEDLISPLGRHTHLVQDSYFSTYALAKAQEQIDSQMPVGWPFDCLTLDRDEVVDSLQSDYSTIEILDTTFHY